MGDNATLILTKRRLKDLLDGLNSLDAIRTGKDELIAFEFPRAVHSALAQNYVAAERALQAFNQFDRACRKRHNVFDGLPRTAENAARIEAYTQEIEEEQDTEVPLTDFTRLKLSALLTAPARDGDKKPRSNPIPQSVLNRLWPIIDDDCAPS